MKTLLTIALAAEYDEHRTIAALILFTLCVWYVFYCYKRDMRAEANADIKRIGEEIKWMPSSRWEDQD